VYTFATKKSPPIPSQVSVKTTASMEPPRAEASLDLNRVEIKQPLYPMAALGRMVCEHCNDCDHNHSKATNTGAHVETSVRRASKYVGIATG